MAVLTEPFQPRRQRRVLIADDASPNRALLASMLRRHGMLVETACDGLEAVDKAKRNDFDLALLDIEMPGLSGDAAAQRIRELEKFGSRKIPILAVTSLTSRSAIRRAASAGMDGVLLKPIDERQLKEVIDGFIPTDDGFSSTDVPPCDE